MLVERVAPLLSRNLVLERSHLAEIESAGQVLAFGQEPRPGLRRLLDKGARPLAQVTRAPSRDPGRPTHQAEPCHDSHENINTTYLSDSWS